MMRIWKRNHLLDGRQIKDSVTGKLMQIKQKSIQQSFRTLLSSLKAPCSWDTVLVISYVIAVSVDPLFFYLPIIDEETKCLTMDRNLRIAALLLRAITDLAFILNIIDKIKLIAQKARSRAIMARSRAIMVRYDKFQFAKEFVQLLPWHSLIVDILGVLPIPQVLMGVLFKMRSSKYLSQIKIINVFLLGQYLPRIYRMHHSSMKIRRTKGVWIRGAFYFFMYILASHVLGAFWYFFSIQREISCWHQTCIKHRIIECNYSCDQDISSRNMTFVNSLDEFCLVDVPANATTPFNFGIFLDSLISGVTGKVNFGKKFLYSFWWGLRNLSNFGTNLETSPYELENCFAILISIIGLLLFLYLIGKVQSFILMKNEIAEEKRKKLSSMEIDIQLWMVRNGLPKEMKNKIRNIVQKDFEKMRDADMESLFSILPAQTRIALKRFLCMETLMKVPFPLKTMAVEEKEIVQEKLSTSICNFLKPVMYQENSFVFRIGEPLDRMLLITEGLVWTYTTTSSSSQDGDAGTSATCLEKGAYYGDELVRWASVGLNSLATVPMVKASVKCHTKIEGFVLLAKDLKVLVDRYKVYWGFPDSKVRSMAAIQTIIKAHRQRKGRPELPKVLHPEAALVPEVRKEDATTASSQVP